VQRNQGARSGEGREIVGTLRDRWGVVWRGRESGWALAFVLLALVTMVGFFAGKPR